MKSKHIGYDETKKMLNTLRRLNESKQSSNTLREQMENGGQQPQANDTTSNNDSTVINDVEVKLLSNDPSDMKLTDEQKTGISGLIDNFKAQVSQLVEFEPGMTINEQQIRLDGHIDDLKFVLIAGENDGLFLNAEMLKLEQEQLDLITKLSKFLKVYQDAVNPYINQRKNNL